MEGVSSENAVRHGLQQSSGGNADHSYTALDVAEGDTPIELRDQRRQRRVGVAILGLGLGLGLACFCAALISRPPSATKNKQKDILEEIPFPAPAPPWHPYDWGHTWHPYQKDHNVFDYMYKDPSTAGKDPMADLDAPNGMAQDGVREWGQNAFYQFHGDITKGPRRQAVAIIDGLGLKGEHHFLGTGSGGAGGLSGARSAIESGGGLPMPGSAAFQKAAGKDLGANGAAIASDAGVGAGGGEGGKAAGGGTEDGGAGGEGGAGGGANGGGSEEGGGGDGMGGDKQEGLGGGGMKASGPGKGSDCYLLPELCPQRWNWHPYRPEFVPGSPEAIAFAKKQAEAKAAANEEVGGEAQPGQTGPGAAQAAEAAAEKAPKVSFAVDTSVDNGAQGKGESISINTGVDASFVGGPKVVPMAAKATRVSTLLSDGEEEAVEESMPQAKEDPALQRQYDDELTKVEKHYDLTVGTTNFGDGVKLNDGVMPGQSMPADQVWSTT